jgi:HEAT repeat protein
MSDIAMLINELKTGNEIIKQNALHQLLEVGETALQPAVEVVINAEHQHVEWTLEGFDHQEGEGRKSDFNQLRDGTKYENWYVAAISELVIKLGSGSLPILIPLLTHDRPIVRGWAAYILGAIADTSAIIPLMERLDSTDNQERYRVIEALGKLKATQAVEKFIAFLQDDTVDGVSATALGKIRDLRALMPLIALLKANKPSVYSASTALYHFGEQAVEPLIEVLFDMNAQKIQDLAIMELGFIGDKRAIEPLLKVLESTNDPKIKCSAVITLGTLKAQQAIEPISKILYETNDGDIRWSCSMALGKIGGKQAFDVLVHALENGTSGVQHNVALAFGEMGNVEEIEPILTAMKHSDQNVRSAIAVSLGNLRDKRAVDALRAALNDADATTRNFVADALQKIKNQDAE